MKWDNFLFYQSSKETLDVNQHKGWENLRKGVVCKDFILDQYFSRFFN